MSLTGSIYQGLSAGEQIRGLRDERELKKSQAQKSELLSGLGRKSLGLGGETQEQMQQATAEMSALDPEYTQKFYNAYKLAGEQQRALVNKSIQDVGKFSIALSESPDEDLAENALQTAEYFQANGDNVSASRFLKVAELAQTNPAQARNLTKNYLTEAQTLEQVLKGSGDEVDSDSVQSSRILADGTTIMTMKSGATEVLSPEGGKLTGAQRTKAIRDANEEEIRIAGGRAKTVSESKEVGSQLGQYQNDINTWDITKTGVQSAFPDIASILEKSPESSFSNAVSKYVSMSVGNTEGQDAQAQIQQLGSMLLQSVPIPPGAQSEAELENRKQTYGDLSNPNISVPTKIKLIENYFKFQEAKASAAQEKISGKKKTVTAPSQAPANSVMWLEQNNTAENRKFFQEKYGYLPEGF